MKRIIHILYMAAMLLAVTACSDEINSSMPDGINKEQVELNFSTSICDEEEVSTRNVDPDGWGLQTLWLFCFDHNGNFIGRSQASLGREPITSSTRTFTAIVSSRTRIVHLLANQVLDGVFNDNDNLGASENTVMTGLESTSSSMVYWGRVDYSTLNTPEEFQTAFNQKVIPMWRNHAAITYNAEKLPAILKVEGFAICNYYANGTSVPFNSSTNRFDWEENWIDKPFITTPLNYTKASDPMDVDTEKTTYIYETHNQGKDEMYLIFKLNINGKSGYYKVAMVDENKDPLPIYRNYKYIIQFDEKRAPTVAASPDFESAKKAAPLNNTWVAVSAEIPSIGNQEQGILSIVGKTTKIYETGGEKTLEYTYTGKGTPVVSWVSDDGVAASEKLTHQFSGGKGSITFTAREMKDDEVHRGMLQVKAGPLVRFIKIVTVKKFSFTPVWCSSGIAGGKAHEDVALTFNIPASYPKELLPLRCLISTTELSGNGAVKLDVVYANDPEFGEQTDHNIGYKYVYMAEKVGQQRIYFQTNYVTSKPSGNITLEAEHFTTMKKQYDFSQNNLDLQLELTGDFVSKFEAKEWGSTQDDSFIYYQLIPKKKGAEVVFKLRYTRDGNFNQLYTLPAGVNIAIYTSNLKPVDTNLFKYQESSYGSGPYWYFTTQAGLDELRFTTQKANSEEVIRMVSIKPNGSGEYRSCTMELANYHEWDFNQDGLLSITPCDYGEQRDVEISFAIKSFMSNHQDPSIPNIPIEPGEGFKVYIDTRNLAIGDNPSKVIEKTPSGYSYTVAKKDIENGKVTLKFKTNKIVSAESITLRTDEEISFIPAELILTNRPLTGTITYGNDEVLPPNAFVTIERKDGTRIGRVSLTDGGARYNIILRGEFNFLWDDEIYMTYKTNSKLYQSPTTLEQLYQTKTINLQEIR